MKTPNDLFATFTELVNTARQSIIDLMKSHGVKSLNTNVYMYEYDYDLVDVSVYNIKMDCVFYEPIAMITLDEQDNIHVHGEKSGDRYEPMTTDWLNIYSLVYDIFNDVDNGEIELFGDIVEDDYAEELFPTDEEFNKIYDLVVVVEIYD